MENTSDTSKKFISCRTKDGDVIEVKLEAIRQSKTFDNMYQDLNLAEDPSFIFEMKIISTAVFHKIHEWLVQHIGVAEPVIQVDIDSKERKWFELNKYQQNFLQRSVDELEELMVAASYLDIPSLHLYSAQTIAEQIRKVINYPQKVRDLLHLPDDLSSEEKAEIKKANPWCNYDEMQE